MHQRLRPAHRRPSLSEHVSLVKLFLVMRNVDVRETQLLEDGLRRVEDLLPSSWEASIFAVEGGRMISLIDLNNVLPEGEAEAA